MLVRRGTFLALSAFGSWGYFHKSLTPGLKENSTLGQCDISVLGHPPRMSCAVLKLVGFEVGLTRFEFSSIICTDHLR